jgi:hypothetical protein
MIFCWVFFSEVKIMLGSSGEGLELRVLGEVVECLGRHLPTLTTIMQELIFSFHYNKMFSNL